jgi:hypothetical protein
MTGFTGKGVITAGAAVEVGMLAGKMTGTGVPVAAIGWIGAGLALPLLAPVNCVAEQALSSTNKSIERMACIFIFSVGYIANRRQMYHKTKNMGLTLHYYNLIAVGRGEFLKIC